MFGKIGKSVLAGGIVLLAWLVVASVWSFLWPPAATADVGSGRAIKMVLDPRSGFHSDFGRKFVITSRNHRTVVPVFEDTGWWRATPLYQAEDGRFILIDFAFHDVLFCEDGINVDPPGYTNGFIAGRKNIDACPGVELLEDAPPAQYWQEFGKWRYIGVFLHPRKDQPFAFKSLRDLPEPSPDTYDPGG